MHSGYLIGYGYGNDFVPAYGYRYYSGHNFFRRYGYRMELPSGYIPVAIPNRAYVRDVTATHVAASLAMILVWVLFVVTRVTRADPSQKSPGKLGRDFFYRQPIAALYDWN